jgi:hypothetical protein
MQWKSNTDFDMTILLNFATSDVPRVKSLRKEELQKLLRLAELSCLYSERFTLFY